MLAVRAVSCQFWPFSCLFSSHIPLSSPLKGKQGRGQQRGTVKVVTGALCAIVGGGGGGGGGQRVCS